MAAPVSPKERTPPPVIGKVGRYTVFITSPTTPKNAAPEGARSLDGCPRTHDGVSPGKVASLSVKAKSPSMAPATSPLLGGSAKTNSGGSPRKVAPLPLKAATLASPVLAPPPPVQVPPQQFEKPPSKGSAGSMFGFFRDAVAKVQDAHSSLDEYLAVWFGLNQSKYQWALNDYYESSGKDASFIQFISLQKKESGKGGKAEQIVSKGQAVQ